MEELKGSFDKGSLGKTYTKKEMMPVDKGAGVYITEEVDVPFENQAFQRVAGTLNPFSKDAFVPGIVGALASEAVDPDIGETSEEQIRKAKELSDPQRFAYDQVSEYPYGSDRYYGGLRESGVYPSMDAERLARSTGISLAQARAYLASKYGVMAADGGEVIGPGTGTSDSIPARLSDGEFVMTAEAVRNAGNGDRDLGAARMYDMMSRFENGRA